ncbi:MAG: ABC transporter ATP-binding protein [Proteobacteria bacterium]|nr:MAG: ABC transporter ATP-binding protein [Pseudomonadota bacterium]QKK11528.1 MAG: ABC transporter ATP-binding protein [Pseudomonadota bacterium]
MSTLLQIDGLGISFGGVKALHNVGLGLDAGEILALIGPNGAGKTTVFNCISGLYQPNRGRIVLDGREIQGLRPHKVAGLGIARTFQNIELFKHMTTVDNLLLGRHLHMRTGVLSGMALLGAATPAAREERRHRQRVEEIIDFLDLQAVRGERVGNLPYGVQKVVELGRALAMEPRVLLLDEPAAGMNLEEKQDLRIWIEDISQLFGIAVLLIEHDMQFVGDLADRVIALNYGERIAEGTPPEVRAHPEVLKAYLGETTA